MARRPDLERFALQHQLKIGTIADLIRYRLLHEKTVEQVAECDIDTDFGPFRLHTFQDMVDGSLHHALVKGVPNAEEPVLVRVHLPDTLRDLLGAQILDGSRPLRSALQRIAEESAGVIVVLNKQETSNETVRRLRMMGLEQESDRPLPSDRGQDGDLRTYGLGAQILHDLGVRRMRVLSAPVRIHAISGFGLDVVDYVS
jgi:3,4-dihydroxy 2-butanone 4-phosphate synthase/GTP cyclohydrolase II